MKSRGNYSVDLRFMSFIVVSLLIASVCQAKIKWDSNELKLGADLGGRTCEFAFVFTNVGKLPIEFDTPSASCACTLVEFDETVFLPGESGVVKGTYNTSGRRGSNRVTITASGNEIDGEVRRPFADKLKLIVMVPEIVKITPGIILWRKSEGISTKTIRFEINKASPVSLKQANVSTNAFLTEWREIKAGESYELLASPISTAEGQRAVVTVEGINKSSFLSVNEKHNYAFPLSAHLPIGLCPNGLYNLPKWCPCGFGGVIY